MTFSEWQALSPAAAAREVRRRVETLLPPKQRRPVIAALPDEDALAAGFAAAPPGSPLRGVPYLLKDLFDVAGLPTFAGSTFLPEVRPAAARDGAIVRALREAGAVFAGKTHLFEFAWGLTGENPHYGDCERPGFPGRTSGGSSSGSAAAVAAGIVPLAIGTDTGGSIRAPAAFCGLYGFRGVPRHPWIADAFPLASSFDTAGWFTQTASDLRAALTALGGLERSGRTPRGCVLELPGLDPEVAEAFRIAAARLASPADTATREALLAGFSGAAAHYGVLASSESWKVHSAWADRWRDRYSSALRERLDRARAITPAAFAAAAQGAAALRSCWADYFQAYDFLVLPATPCAALAKAELTPANRIRMLDLTAPASLAGAPVLTMPVPLPSGLTAGLQIIANHSQSPVFDWALQDIEANDQRFG